MPKPPLPVAVLALLLSTLALPGCGAGRRPTATATVRQALDHIPGSALHVDSENGRIEVLTSGAQPGVVIEARFTCSGGTDAEARERVAGARILAERDTSRLLMIRPEFPGGPRDGDGASFIVRLPDAHDVIALTSNGAVRVSGTTGDLVVDTSNGPINVTDHDGPAELETSNGPVTAMGVSGPLRIESANGAVHATDVAAPVRIDTSNGSITLAVRRDQAGPIHLDTSNGTIHVTVGSAFTGRVVMHTANAGIAIQDRAGVIGWQNVQKSRAELLLGEGGEASSVATSNGQIVLTIEE